MLRSAQLEVRSLQALARIGPLAALVAALLTACSAPPPPPPPVAARGDLAESLVELGERALERGALDDAVDGVERARQAPPPSEERRVWEKFKLGCI